MLINTCNDDLMTLMRAKKESSSLTSHRLNGVIPPIFFNLKIYMYMLVNLI